MFEQNDIITIDGPAGVGKSTVSKMVARITGYTYLDTGAMYRGVGYFLDNCKIDLADQEKVAEALLDLDLTLLPSPNGKDDVGVLVNGVDVSSRIRTVEMSMLASKVSALAPVREKLTVMQQQIGSRGGVVAEGRDTGTVVFPFARYKFFLEAEPGERARRRVAQLQAKGEKADYQQLLAMIIKRDADDSGRSLAPLRQATDAHLIDTTNLTVDQVVAEIARHLPIVQVAGRKG